MLPPSSEGTLPKLGGNLEDLRLSLHALGVESSARAGARSVYIRYLE